MAERNTLICNTMDPGGNYREMFEQRRLMTECNTVMLSKYSIFYRVVTGCYMVNEMELCNKETQ